MDGIFKFFGSNPTMIVAIFTALGTIALAVATWLYLKQTRRMVDIIHKSYHVDFSPKVFISGIKTERTISIKERKFGIKPICEITNLGKTEAKKPEVAYKISWGDLEIKKKIKPASYLYPTQKAFFDTGVLWRSLGDKDIEVAKQAFDSKIKPLIPKEFAPPILLDIKLKYLDHEDKKQERPFNFSYNWDSDTWSIYLPKKKK